MPDKLWGCVCFCVYPVLVELLDPNSFLWLMYLCSSDIVLVCRGTRDVFLDDVGESTSNIPHGKQRTVCMHLLRAILNFDVLFCASIWVLFRIWRSITSIPEVQFTKTNASAMFVNAYPLCYMSCLYTQIQRWYTYEWSTKMKINSMA